VLTAAPDICLAVNGVVHSRFGFTPSCCDEPFGGGIRYVLLDVAPNPMTTQDILRPSVRLVCPFTRPFGVVVRWAVKVMGGEVHERCR